MVELHPLLCSVFDGVVLDLIACNPSKDNSKCEENLKKISKKYASSLFQHIGIESSLKGKTQKIKVIN